MKSAAWFVCFPGDPYALGPFRFEKAVTETELRTYVREVFCKIWWGYVPKRLPNGVSAWRAT